MEKLSRLMLLLLAFTSLHGGDESRLQANSEFPVQNGEFFLHKHLNNTSHLSRC